MGILWEHKSTKIFCYSIAAAPEEGASPAEVARVYKALGDEDGSSCCGASATGR